MVSEFAFQGLVGDLAGVEEFAGTLFVEGFFGEAVGDLAGGSDDGVAVFERLEVEAAVGTDVDGRGLDAVVDAEVLAADGGFGAAGLMVEVLEALVELVWVAFVWRGVVHGYPYPPPGAVEKLKRFVENVGARQKEKPGRVPGLLDLIS